MMNKFALILGTLELKIMKLLSECPKNTAIITSMLKNETTAANIESAIKSLGRKKLIVRVCGGWGLTEKGKKLLEVLIE